MSDRTLGRPEPGAFVYGEEGVAFELGWTTRHLRRKRRDGQVAFLEYRQYRSRGPKLIGGIAQSLWPVKSLNAIKAREAHIGALGEHAKPGKMHKL